MGPKTGAEAVPASGPVGVPTHRPPSRRRSFPWTWIGGGLAVLAGLLGFLVLFAGAKLDAATFGLVAVAASLGFFLASLRRMAVVLARPDVDVALEVEGQGLAARELQAEKRRVLRAIKELDFDHAMGKLSDADYAQVRQRYEVRAVEAMAAADDEPRLHPGLATALNGLQDGSAAMPVARKPPAEGEPAASQVSNAPEPGAPQAMAEPDRTGVGCVPCGASNDFDARFCKQCGAKLQS